VVPISGWTNIDISTFTNGTIRARWIPPNN
jgi:hypothetical protein